MEELICFRYSLNDKHSHCHDMETFRGDVPSKHFGSFIKMTKKYVLFTLGSVYSTEASGAEQIIVNRGKCLLSLEKFFVQCFCLLFLAMTLHKDNRS